MQGLQDLDTAANAPRGDLQQPVRQMHSPLTWLPSVLGNPHLKTPWQRCRDPTLNPSLGRFLDVSWQGLGGVVSHRPRQAKTIRACSKTVLVQAPSATWDSSDVVAAPIL